MGISVQVSFRDHLLPNRDRVPRKKSVTPIIAGQAKLAAAGDGFKLTGVGLESEIVPAQRDRLRLRLARRAHFAIAAPIGAIDPVVETPGQAIDAQLLVAFGETGEK